MAAELEVIFVQRPGDGPLDRVQLGRQARTLSSLFANEAISLRRTALSDFKRAFSSTRDPTCAMTSSDLPSARLLAAFAIACLTAAPVSHATIGDSFTGGGLSFLRTASLSDSRWSRILAGCLARGFGLSAGAEVAGSASLTRSHAVLRMQPAHLSSAVQIPTFFGRPLRLAGKAGAERPSPGEMSCPRPARQR